jgi:iron complex outermembrane recepter protein
MKKTHRPKNHIEGFFARLVLLLCKDAITKRLTKKMGGSVRAHAALCRGALAMLLMVSLPGWADEALEKKVYDFDIPKLQLDVALNTLAQQTGIQLLFPYDLTKNMESKPVAGRQTLAAALQQLLKDTGLSSSFTQSGVITISQALSKNSEEREAMNKRKGIFAAVMGVLFSSSGIAQQAVSEGESDRMRNAVLEEIVVTAQKREERLIDVPMSISALSGETVENAGMQNIIDLSYAVPNLSVREEGPGLQTIAIRGMGNFIGSSSLVGLYLDEVPVSGEPNAAINLQTLDLARVEVLKGPQGSLYGQGAVGGTIRFITKAPSFDGIEGNVGISLYDTHKGDMSEEVTGVLNLPVVDDVLALRVAGTYKNKGGWIDRPAINDDDFNDNELANVRVKALWQATDRLSINAMTNHHRNEAGGFSYVNLQPLSSSQFQTAADPSLPSGVEDDYDLYNLTINYQFDFATLTSSTSSIDLDKKFLNRSQFLELAALGSFENALSTSYQIESFSQELRLSSHQEQRLTWTVGAFYSDLKVHNIASDSYRTLNGVPLPLIPLLADSTEYSESVAVFGDIAYALTEQLTVGVGSRYFEDARKLTNHINGVIFEEDFDNISSRLYLSYAVNDQANFYASVSEGFRSGGFNSLATTTLPQAYEPDEVTSYEVGVKANLFDQRLSAELSLYYADYTDAQGYVVKDLLGSGGIGESGVINGGDAEVKGVEWLLQWAVTDALSLGFSGNVTDAEVVSLPGSGIVPDKNPGDPLDFVPDYSYSVIADYHFSWSTAVPGYAQFSYHRQGPSSLVNRLVGVLDPVSESGSIGFLNLQLGARFQNIDLQLFARNLLDEDRPTAADAANGQRLPQARPRTIGVNLNYQF